MRADLFEIAGITEVKMFGGLCFLQDRHMLCGVHAEGGMYRVGKSHYETALAKPGVQPMMMTGRPMTGIVDIDSDAIADDDLRASLLDFALEFVSSLPAK